MSDTNERSVASTGSVADGESDRPKPINAARLAALEELSALDQALELQYGLTGNPMITAQGHTPDGPVAASASINWFLRRRHGLRYLPYRVWVRISNFVRRIYRSTIRACQYAYVGWHNSDWDYNFLLELLEFKLARMNKSMWHYTVGEKQSKQSLRLAARLAKKLRTELYHWHYDRHEKRWGPTTSEFLPCESMPGYTTWKMTRAKVTDENREQMEEELKLAFELDEKVRRRDAAWLFGIMAKYYDHWWD